MSSSPPLYDGGTALASRPKRHCTTTKPVTKRFTGTRARACQACDIVHHKCLGVPCDRCFRLSLRCRPSPNLGAVNDRSNTTPLLELLLKRHVGHAMANLYMQQFAQALREGLVDGCSPSDCFGRGGFGPSSQTPTSLLAWLAA